MGIRASRKLRGIQAYVVYPRIPPKTPLEIGHGIVLIQPSVAYVGWCLGANVVLSHAYKAKQGLCPYILAVKRFNIRVYSRHAF